MDLSTFLCQFSLSGDTESLWKVDKLRSETYNQHTLSTAFSCAKVDTSLFYLVLMFITFIAYTLSQGFLLESKPEEAAAVIQLICQVSPKPRRFREFRFANMCLSLTLQTYGDDKKSAVLTEFKKLVNEWHVDVIRHLLCLLTLKPRVYVLISLLCIMLEQALGDSLESVIPSMVNVLLSSGLNVSVDLDELYKKDALLS